MTDRRAPGTAAGQGHGDPNPACPAGQERGYWAGQPLPRHRSTMANYSSNGSRIVNNWGCAHGVSSSLEFASPCSAIAFLAALSASEPGRLRDTQPSMLRCEPPDTASAPGGTSSRTTVPAPV